VYWTKGIWNYSSVYLVILSNVHSYFQLHHHQHHHHHHHVHEGIGMFPVPWSSRQSWSLHLFLGRPMFLLPFGLYCRACFAILFVSILCMCCCHFSWYCFISFTICALVFPLMHWFFSVSSFVIPSKCLKIFNYIEAILFLATSNTKDMNKWFLNLFTDPKHDPKCKWLE